ncbi:MAG: hypothetical protein SVK08_00825, partial [Halobacteriota archaeon]|nr:hypothetical protein [Halobacteriota archaeon]
VNPVDGLLSTSATNPVLPSGYNTFRRVGWIRNNASSNFIVGIQVGNGKQKWWHYSGPRTNTNILSAGNATTDTVLSAAAYVPPTSQLCHLNVDLDATSAWRDAGLRINSGGSGARTTRHWQFQLGAAPSTTMRVGTDVFFLDENQELIYSMDNSDSSITVHVVAYLDSL